MTKNTEQLTMFYRWFSSQSRLLLTLRNLSSQFRIYGVTSQSSCRTNLFLINNTGASNDGRIVRKNIWDASQSGHQRLPNTARFFIGFLRFFSNLLIFAAFVWNSYCWGYTLRAVNSIPLAVGPAGAGRTNSRTGWFKCLKGNQRETDHVTVEKSGLFLISKAPF